MSLVNVEKTLNDIEPMDAFQKVSKMSREEVLQKLERISLITELEDRYYM